MQATDNLKKPVRLGALSMAKVVAALMRGPCSVPDLMALSGLSCNTVHEYMRALRKESVVHIGAWARDATGRESLRVYQWGAGKDAVRAKKTKAQIARECRQRKANLRRMEKSAQDRESGASFFWPLETLEPMDAKMQSPTGEQSRWISHRLR